MDLLFFITLLLIIMSCIIHIDMGIYYKYGKNNSKQQIDTQIDYV